jgi:hypothetical protein
MAVFWDVAPCGLLQTDRRFRGAYCLHHRGDRTLYQGVSFFGSAMFLMLLNDAIPIAHSLLYSLQCCQWRNGEDLEAAAGISIAFRDGDKEKISISIADEWTKNRTLGLPDMKQDSKYSTAMFSLHFLLNNWT